MIEYDPSVEGERTVYPGVRRTPSHSINTVFVLIARTFTSGRSYELADLSSEPSHGAELQLIRRHIHDG